MNLRPRNLTPKVDACSAPFRESDLLMRFAVLAGYLTIGLSGMAFFRPSPQTEFFRQSTLAMPHQPVRHVVHPKSFRSEKVAEIPVVKSKLRLPTVASQPWVAATSSSDNPQTREFLAWAKGRWVHYCVIQLDHQGRCIAVQTHICWNITDEELKVISGLKDVQSLSCNGSALTDSGLRFIVNMPALRHLRLTGAANVTETALQRLRDARPDIEFELPYRPQVDR